MPPYSAIYKKGAVVDTPYSHEIEVLKNARFQDKSCQISVQHACFLYKIIKQEKDKLKGPEKKERNDWLYNVLYGLKSQTIEK